jgi:hypothetical protein
VRNYYGEISLYKVLCAGCAGRSIIPNVLNVYVEFTSSGIGFSSFRIDVNMKKRKSNFLIGTCEEKSANARQLTFNKTFRQVTFDWLLLQLWGYLIADAPSAVTVLEKLIVMCLISREWIFDSTLNVYLLANTNS